MTSTQGPLDSRDDQSTWAKIWLVIGAVVSALYIAVDAIAADSVFDTWSWIGGYWALRHPWAVVAIEGVVGHMVLQRDATPALQMTPYSFLNFAIAVFVLAGLWEGARHLTALDRLGFWSMYVVVVCSPLFGAYVWPLRPTW
jgi:hypothetical protein